MEVNERKVNDENGGFRKGKSCVDQILVMIMMVERGLLREG